MNGFDIDQRISTSSCGLMGRKGMHAMGVGLPNLRYGALTVTVDHYSVTHA